MTDFLGLFKCFGGSKLVIILVTTKYKKLGKFIADSNVPTQRSDLLE